MRVWVPDPPKGYEYLKKIVFDIVEYDVERSALRVRIASNRKFGIGGGRPPRCWIPPDSLIGAEYTIVWSRFRESR